MWALTKYCAERTHFTPNIPLKILLSLVTAAVAVATYSVVFAFAVLKLLGTGLHKVWLTINNPAVHANVAEIDRAHEEEHRRIEENNRLVDEDHEECLEAIYQAYVLDE